MKFHQMMAVVFTVCFIVIVISIFMEEPRYNTCIGQNCLTTTSFP